ncbi:MAG: bifunctional precorrin-2 dehydrogenase/sirohydrochlorin ferrochelatase [Cyclobacteriaceae bacterium]|nr:bifunctional precorrin-2 dehydrogenase/sirohydrochlorin ferrochelatase [Cyclobacteriaceae bacterium]
MENRYESETNLLFPIFLKLNQLRLTIIGGGNVAIEKLNAVLSNSPETNIKLVSLTIDPEIEKLSGNHSITLHKKKYEAADLENTDILIVAINDRAVSKQIYDDAHAKGILINVADTPDLCDFYLGSIVKKGNLKIAISTNGKSPTLAKRLKEMFAELLPDELDEVSINLNSIRNKLTGDFKNKIDKLNEITKVLTEKESEK